MSTSLFRHSAESSELSIFTENAFDCKLLSSRGRERRANAIKAFLDINMQENSLIASKLKRSYTIKKPSQIVPTRCPHQPTICSYRKLFLALYQWSKSILLRFQTTI